MTCHRRDRTIGPVAAFTPEYFMGYPPRRRTLPLNEWQTNLDRSSFAMDANCTFALGKLDRVMFDE
jgi:hypothetical protein